MDERVKAHWNEHKHKYGYGLCGAAIVVLGVLVLRKSPTTIINTVAPVFNNNNSSKASLGGHLRKIVYCAELDKWFGSVLEAAAFAGVSQPAMSKHLNGHTDHVKGLIYEIVAVAN